MASPIRHGGPTGVPACRRPRTTSAGIYLFRRVGAVNLVLELTLDRAAVGVGEWNWLIWLPLLTLVPGCCVLGLCLAVRGLARHGDRVEAGARVANEERIRLLANMNS